MPLVAIMNGLAFEGGERGRKFDANFASRSKGDHFEYFIQRLAGVEVDSEEEPRSGRLWVPYVNRVREDWSFICENNRIVAKDDEVLFKFETLL